MLELFIRAQSLWGRVRERAQDAGGASAVEYGLLLALIAAVIMVVVKVLGQHVSNAYSSATVGWP